MEVNRLLDSELTYELLIRGYPIGGTVEQKRSSLRQLFRLEREGAASAPTAVALNAFEEMTLCEAKLSGLEGEIRFFNFDNRKNEYQRLYTRLIHVTLRLGRLTPEDGMQSRHIRELISKGRKLIGDLNLAYEGFPYVEVSQENMRSHDQSRVSLLDTDNPLLPEVIHSQVFNTDNLESRNPPANLPDSCNRRLSNQPETLLIPELVVEQQPVASSSHVYNVPPHGNNYQLPTRVATIPTTSSAVYSSPQLRESLYGRQLQPRPVGVGFSEPNPSGNRTTSRVRFVSGLSNIEPNEENWSRMPNDEYLSNVNDSLPLGNTESLSNRLADLHFSPANVDTVPGYYERPRYLEPGRWNVKYDGVSSVNNFLERIEELRISRGASKQHLFRSAAELFTHDALLWYRSNYFSSWDDLVIQLRDAFQPYDYENGIWEELRRRTQGAHERVVVFVASMEQLFNRLSQKPSETDRVKLIRRNLLPYIQSQLSLQSVNSVRELVQVCRAIEETESRIKQFCPPPTNYRQLLEPQLAYRKPTGILSPAVASVSTDSSVPSQISGTPLAQAAIISKPDVNTISCWNCHGTGHRFRQCDQPRRIFCFKCGYDNVLATKCPKCTKNGQMGRQ